MIMYFYDRTSVIAGCQHLRSSFLLLEERRGEETGEPEIWIVCSSGVSLTDHMRLELRLSFSFSCYLFHISCDKVSENTICPEFRPVILN